jgi:putative nucleotidyltransferase with HDIG domain
MRCACGSITLLEVGPVNVEALLAKVEDLSALAPSVVKLLDLLNRPEVENESVVQVVRTDAVLSAKLLALANSVYFAPQTPIESVEEALFFLGYDQVYRLALAVGIGGVMNRRAAGYAMDEGEFWRHSLVTARAGEMIAAVARESEGSIGYTAGLLHDIGKLVLNQFLDPQAQAAIARAIDERGQAGIVAEQNLLKTNHAEVGAALLKKWNLPKDIIDAAEFHHDDTRISSRWPSVIALADAMAHMAVSGKSGLPEHAEAELLQRVGLSAEKYEEILGEVSAALVEIEAVSLVA